MDILKSLMPHKKIDVPSFLKSIKTPQFDVEDSSQEKQVIN